MDRWLMDPQLIYVPYQVKGAQERGAVATLIYSDPRDDGTVTVENGYAPCVCPVCPVVAYALTQGFKVSERTRTQPKLGPER